MRPFYIAGNWKMHKTPTEAARYATELCKVLAGCPNKLMIAPPFIAIPAVKQAIGNNESLLIGAQNCSCEEQGAHTGEVAPAMLVEAGVSTVIIGHSERRKLYSETDQLIQKKVERAVNDGLEVILCVGESLAERENGQAMEVVTRQLKAGLENIQSGDMPAITIAYEPVWAIGTGKTASPEEANRIHAGIRDVIALMFTSYIAENLCIQYGGSVKSSNVQELMAMEHIDGALVGGASLEIESFTAIAMFNKE